MIEDHLEEARILANEAKSSANPHHGISLLIRAIIQIILYLKETRK